MNPRTERKTPPVIHRKAISKYNSKWPGVEQHFPEVERFAHIIGFGTQKKKEIAHLTCIDPVVMILKDKGIDSFRHPSTRGIRPRIGMRNLLESKEISSTSIDPAAAGGAITVAMITMNEEGAVAKVIGDVRAALPGAEVLIVDSSTDGTPEIAASLGARVIRQVPPQGYGPAMDMALRSARRSVIVTLDCDDTYPIERIAPMAGMILDDGYDVVDGSRLERKPPAMPWINFLANWFFAVLASALFGRRVTDLHSGMRAYRKDVLDALGHDPKGAALPVELLLRPIRQGRRVASVFIPYRERIGHSTLRPLESAWWTFRRILRARFL
jgi:hypothetical protein